MPNAEYRRIAKLMIQGPGRYFVSVKPGERIVYIDEGVQVEGVPADIRSRSIERHGKGPFILLAIRDYEKMKPQLVFRDEYGQETEEVFHHMAKYAE